MQFFTLGSSKIQVSETYLFAIVTTQNDHPRYVKHVLGSIYVFFTLFGYWVQGEGGLPRDWYTTCLCCFSPWAGGRSKIEVFETYFFDIMTIQNDHPTYVKHVLGGILALRTHCALLLDYVPPEEPPGTPLGNALRIR